MEKIMKMIFALLITGALLLMLGYSFVPEVRTAINEIRYGQKVVDEETDYTNRKGVEDQARAMLANYNANKQEYETYKEFVGTDDKARAQRALDAKTSVNRTVASYNEYLTKNNFVFKGNLPSDIPMMLEYLD